MSLRGSGRVGASRVQPGESPVAAAHQGLTAREAMAQLRPQRAVGMPLPAHVFGAVQRLGDAALRSPGLRAIERLQGV